MDNYIALAIITLTSLLILFLAYKIIRWMSREKPLWVPIHEEFLKKQVHAIYSADNLATLATVISTATKIGPRYRKLFKTARKERASELGQISTSLPFEIREKRIKRFWLITLFVNCIIFSCISWFLEHNAITQMLTAQLYHASVAEKIIILEKMQWMHMSLNAFSAISLFLTIYINYRCSYKKRGTRLLIFNLVCPLLTLILCGIAYALGSVFGPLLNLFSVSFIQKIIMSFLSLLMWISSFYLLRINYEARAQKKLTALKNLLLIPLKPAPSDSENHSFSGCSSPL